MTHQIWGYNNFNAKQGCSSQKGIVIVVARTKQEYGSLRVRDARSKHIPFAINIGWQQNIENGCFKEKLSKVYSNILSNVRVIMYCHGGYRAAHSFIALKILGFPNVKIYLGSQGEWGKSPDLPLES